MKSHPYEKTPGGGALTAFPAHSDPATASTPQAQPPDICTYVNAKGGRCRMSIVHPDEALCPDHLNKQRRAELLHTQSVSASLFENLHDFSSPTAVNVFLGNLLRETALKRIDRKDAITLAYIGQLLLNSHANLDRFHKYGFTEKDCVAERVLEHKRQLEVSLYPRQSQPTNANANQAASPNPASSPQTGET